MTLPDTIPLIGIGWNDLLFLVLSAVMIGAALLVVTMRDIIRCGLAMMVSFGALAGMFVLLGAPFVAGAQVLVYIGAISVLVLFAIMLTQTKAGPASLVFQTQSVAAGVAAILVALLIALAVTSTDWGGVAKVIHTHTVDLAKVLFSDFVLPFEVVSVLLLAAVVGGVFIAKREKGGPR